MKGMAAYAGALEPTDKNDTGKHGFIRGEIRGGETRISFVPFAKREYLHLALNVDKMMTARSVMDRILEMIKERGAENLYKFTLKGFRDPDLSLNGNGTKFQAIFWKLWTRRFRHMIFGRSARKTGAI